MRARRLEPAHPAADTAHMRTRPATPLWVRALIVLVVAGGPGWWLVQWHDRVVNQRRLAAIASQIAGRPVHVRCPGVIGRTFAYDLVEGTVAFDAQGRPADVTELRARPCDELEALAEGRRAGVLRCIAVEHWCGAAEDRLAVALDVLTHESVHLSGVRDEAETECRSLSGLAWTAERFGITAEVAQRLATWQATHAYLRMPDRYRGNCALNGQAGAPARR
jgi:hypothetical protein